MNYTRLLLRIKGNAFLFNTAEPPPLPYNGICTFYSQDAYAYQKEKGKTKMPWKSPWKKIWWLGRYMQNNRGMQFLKEN